MDNLLKLDREFPTDEEIIKLSSRKSKNKLKSEQLS